MVHALTSYPAVYLTQCVNSLLSVVSFPGVSSGVSSLHTVA